MLHKNMIEKKNGFCVLDADEVSAVSGGTTQGEPIIVTGKGHQD